METIPPANYPLVDKSYVKPYKTLFSPCKTQYKPYKTLYSPYKTLYQGYSHAKEVSQNQPVPVLIVFVPGSQLLTANAVNYSNVVKMGVSQKGGYPRDPRGYRGIIRGLYRAPLKDNIGVILRNTQVIG